MVCIPISYFIRICFVEIGLYIFFIQMQNSMRMLDVFKMNILSLQNCGHKYSKVECAWELVCNIEDWSVFQIISLSSNVLVATQTSSRINDSSFHLVL